MYNSHIGQKSYTNYHGIIYLCLISKEYFQRIILFTRKCFVFAILQLLLFTFQTSYTQTGNFKEFYFSGRSVVFVSGTGCKLRLTPYGDKIIRVQPVNKEEDFFPDDYYEMVESHDWNGKIDLTEEPESFSLKIAGNTDFELIILKSNLTLQFKNKGKTFLSERNGVEWNGNTISESFAPDSNEHFTGLGHGFFGRSSGIDLTGEVIGRNYGSRHGDQAPLIVPFYLSSNGYGIFLNSAFTNKFIFNRNAEYGFSIENYGSPARLDYFVITGPEFRNILDKYTQLTGRPALPPVAVFGIGLSDKSNDENSKDPSDENWWKRKITEQRNAGIPFDHIINDNRWRAGGGKRCESYFDWDKTRYPNPEEYAGWLKKNGIFITIDLNRCICEGSEGWKDSFNIPFADKVDHNKSVPDFTQKEVRSWFWNLFWKKSLNPNLHFPGDALWIDEFDELGPIPDTVKLGNGRYWGEMKNYWPFLIAKALVQEGWNKSVSPGKRPFVWVRGMTAGAQRYATLWTGDIKPDFDEMKNQIRGMQLAGLSGFPFEGHDQGGFYDWDNKKGPDEKLYRKWSMAMGSFTPFWKPHGWGESRWPLDRSPESLETARKFINLRYQLLPYTYSMAHESSVDGLPIARAMVLNYQNNPAAWQYDLQYMWGDNILVVPNTTEKDSVSLWLPDGNWYDFNTMEIITGSRIINYYSPDGGLTLFIKEGSIIPMYFQASGTAFVKKDKMIVNVFTGNDGDFNLYEDDGISENYKNGDKRETHFSYHENDEVMQIGKANGNFSGAPGFKDYEIKFIGLRKAGSVFLNGKDIVESDVDNYEDCFYWDKYHNILTVSLKKVPVLSITTIRITK